MTSITVKILLQVNSNVTTPYNLLLDDDHLDHGTWKENPPATLTPSNPPVEKKFIARRRDWSVVGPEGTVIYKSTDSNSNPTLFNIYFDVPVWKTENTVSLSGGSEYYTLELSGDYKTGSNPTATVTITQIGPISLE